MTAKIEEVYNYWIKSSVSENTKKSYRRVMPQFFSMMFDKEIKDITKEDIDSILPLSVAKKYKEPLSLAGNKNSTIIQNMSVVSSFFRQLEVNRVFDVNYQWLKEACFNTKRIKNDQQHRGNMSYNDYQNVKTWLSQYEFHVRYADKKDKYPLLLEFMWNTASRITAVFNLKWSDIKYEEDGLGNYGYTAYIHDKGGKVNKKALTNDFYNRLKDVLFQDSFDDKVFKDLSQIGFTGLMKEYCEISDKEFTPHSIKRGSVTFLYSITHDLVLTQRFADHDDPKTTVGYIQAEEDRTKQGSYIISKKFDFDKLNELSKDDLLNIINENKDLQYRMLMEAEKRFLVEGVL